MEYVSRAYPSISVLDTYPIPVCWPKEVSVLKNSKYSKYQNPLTYILLIYYYQLLQIKDDRFRKFGVASQLPGLRFPKIMAFMHSLDK